MHAMRKQTYTYEIESNDNYMYRYDIFEADVFEESGVIRLIASGSCGQESPDLIYSLYINSCVVHACAVSNLPVIMNGHAHACRHRRQSLFYRCVHSTEHNLKPVPFRLLH